MRDECEHGSLKRKCDYCFRDREIASLRAELDAARATERKRIADLLDARAATYSEEHSACVALQQEAAKLRADAAPAKDDERDLSAIKSALAQRGKDSAALFKRHGELSTRKVAGPALTSAEDVELEAVRCALEVTESLNLWEGQRARADEAEADANALRAEVERLKRQLTASEAAAKMYSERSGRFAEQADRNAARVAELEETLYDVATIAREHRDSPATQRGGLTFILSRIERTALTRTEAAALSSAPAAKASETACAACLGKGWVPAREWDGGGPPTEPCPAHPLPSELDEAMAAWRGLGEPSRELVEFVLENNRDDKDYPQFADEYATALALLRAAAEVKP